MSLLTIVQICADDGHLHVTLIVTTFEVMIKCASLILHAPVRCLRILLGRGCGGCFRDACVLVEQHTFQANAGEAESY